MCDYIQKSTGARGGRAMQQAQRVLRIGWAMSLGLLLVQGLAGAQRCAQRLRSTLRMQ